MANHEIPARDKVSASDKWDLSTLYKSDGDWEKDLAKIMPLAKKVAEFKGKLGNSAETLLKALKAWEELNKIIDDLICSECEKCNI